MAAGAKLNRWSLPREQLQRAAYAKSLSMTVRRLRQSIVLDATIELAGTKPQHYTQALRHGARSSTYSKYTQLLRHGAKTSPAVRAFAVQGEVKRKEEAHQLALESGEVIHTVSDESELENVEFWQQGDVSLATKDKLAQREELRYHPRVLEALQSFWEAAQRSLQSGGDASASELHREGHAIMLKRIYRVMIKHFDQDDCDRCIADDWKRDTKGKDVLTRKAFCDAFFELADTWTTGICGHEYAAFLRRLYEAVTIQVAQMGPDGKMTMLSYVWKDEQDVQFDESYDDDDAEEKDAVLVAGSGGGEAAVRADDKAGSLQSNRAKSATSSRSQSVSSKEVESSARPRSSDVRCNSVRPEAKAVDYRAKAKAASEKSGKKNTAATAIQKHLRRKKAKAVKVERQKAVATIQRSTRTRKRSKEDRMKVTKAEAPLLGDRRPRDEARDGRGGTLGARGDMQYWALRKGLPPMLDDEFDDLCDEDKEAIAGLSEAKRRSFLQKRMDKRGHPLREYNGDASGRPSPTIGDVSGPLSLPDRALDDFGTPANTAHPSNIAASPSVFDARRGPPVDFVQVPHACRQLVMDRPDIYANESGGAPSAAGAVSPTNRAGAVPSGSYGDGNVRTVNFDNSNHDIIEFLNLRWEQVMQTAREDSMREAMAHHVAWAHSLDRPHPRHKHGTAEQLSYSSRAPGELSYSSQMPPCHSTIQSPTPEMLYSLANYTPGKEAPLIFPSATYSFWAHINESGPFPATLGMGVANAWQFPSTYHAQPPRRPATARSAAQQANPMLPARPGSRPSSAQHMQPSSARFAQQSGARRTRPSSARTRMTAHVVRPFDLPTSTFKSSRISRPVNPVAPEPPSPEFPGNVTLRSIYYPINAPAAAARLSSARRPRPRSPHPPNSNRRIAMRRPGAASMYIAPGHYALPLS